MWQRWLIWKLVKYAYASYSLRVSAATWRCSGQSWVKWLLYPFSAPCGLWECLGEWVWLVLLLWMWVCEWVWEWGGGVTQHSLAACCVDFLFLGACKAFCNTYALRRLARIEGPTGWGYGVWGKGYWGTGYWVLNSCPASSINFVDWFLLKRAQLDTCPTIP